ncbi:MAG: hypothetical protein WD000_03390 [Thermodesulfobacteriota bacterium]
MRDSEIWKCRDFFEASKQRAENYLKNFDHERLSNHLIRRHISKLIREPVRGKGFLAKSAFTTFNIVISIDDNLETQLVTVGYELAHTFDYHAGDLFLNLRITRTEYCMTK